MKPYLLSLGAGLLVGIVYALLHVRSPAPPVIALVGLLGILIGEQVPSLTRHAFQREDRTTVGAEGRVKPHAFGERRR
ncbi:XapX domain-containing protein [Lysobacter terrae]